MKRILAWVLALALLMGCACAEIQQEMYSLVLEYLGNQQFDEAIALLEQVGDTDGADYVKVLKVGMEGRYTAAINTIYTLYPEYEYADEYVLYFTALQALSDEDYETAADALTELGGFADSEALLELIYGVAEQEALDGVELLMEEGDWESALALYIELGDLELVKECYYRWAEACRAEGDYESALELYSSIITYKDSAEKYDEMEARVLAAQLYVPGESVYFGSYPQSGSIVRSAASSDEGDDYDEDFGGLGDEEYEDEETSASTARWQGGREPIEWIVLDTDGETALLISKYVLDRVYVNTSGDDVEDDSYPAGKSWSSSVMRTWLNSAFIDSAFTSEEAARLVYEKLADCKNPKSNLTAYATTDRVWLLNIEEVEYYFPTDEERICYPTDYARTMRNVTVNDEGACWWWLRNVGSAYGRMADVLRDGSIGYNGDSMENMWIGVRPVIRIKIA